jgi:hypothetical protein
LPFADAFRKDFATNGPVTASIQVYKNFSIPTTLSSITARLWVFTGDENAGCAPAFLPLERSALMSKWRHAEPTRSLKERLGAFAKLMRERAALMPFGAEKTATLAKAEQAEIAADVERWANSPELRPPK